jgi:hypothetical protein
VGWIRIGYGGVEVIDHEALKREIAVTEATRERRDNDRVSIKP